MKRAHVARSIFYRDGERSWGARPASAATAHCSIGPLTVVALEVVGGTLGWWRSVSIDIRISGNLSIVRVQRDVGVVGARIIRATG